MTKRRALVIPLITLVIMTTLAAMAPAAHADGGDFSLDFVAAGPFTYDHDTGVGGEYADRTISKTEGVVESLEGGDFACGDRVVYFTEITVDDGATEVQDIELDFEFLAEPTGQPGVGHVDILSATPNDEDSGMSGPETDDTTVSIVSETSNGSPHKTRFATVAVENLDPGEVFILRIETLLGCLFDSEPTGNLQAAITDARVVAPEEDAIPVGDQTIPFKKIEDISQPASVSVSVGACPAPGSPTRPVTIDIDPPGSATVTITGPGGPYVVTGNGDTLDLEPGDYSWTASAAEGFFLDGPVSGNFTVGECPRIPASVTIDVGPCPAPGSATRPVTVTIDGPVTVTIEGPGGPYVVTETDTLELAPGDYTWTADAPDTHELDVDSGEFTVQECPAIAASVNVTVDACPPTSSTTRPVTVSINPDGAANVDIDGPNGFHTTVTGAGATVDLAAGDYVWSAFANPTFEIIGDDSGSFSVGSCVVQVLPKTIVRPKVLPKTGAGLPGVGAAGFVFLFLGIGLVAASRRAPRPAVATGISAVTDRLSGRMAWTPEARLALGSVGYRERLRDPRMWVLGRRGDQTGRAGPGDG